MESSSGDKEESPEDIPGRKKSTLKSLRTRLFKKSKRAGEERNTKLSQSASDITAGQGLGSDEDLVCSQGIIGSRALSHDSIFQDDEVLTESEPARVLSQENVHSKIKALQIKLQQQKMHLGPPPLVLPIRRPEDLGSHLENDGLRFSSPVVTGSDGTPQGAFAKTVSQSSSRPLSPVPIPALTKYVSPNPSQPSSGPSAPSVTETALDFTSPAHFTPCLDTSAARHRMSVKPRNQRVSTKKRVATTDSRFPSNMPNNTELSESVHEEEQSLCAQDKVTLETDQEEADIPTTAQHVPSKVPEVQSDASQGASKSSSLTLPQQEPAPPVRAPPVSSQVLRHKPLTAVDVASSERPHSSFIESELKSKREAGFEIQVMSYVKRNMLEKTGMSEDSSEKFSTLSSSTVACRPPTVHQQLQEETETTKYLKRPAPGSGSFHFSITTAKNCDVVRPRSRSFVGIREQAEPRQEGTKETSSSSLREREESRDLQPRGSPFTMGRLKQEEAPNQSSVLQWDRRSSLKKIETTVSTSKNADTCSLAGEELEKRRKEVERSQKEVDKRQKEVEKNQEELEDAVEAQEEVQEEEGKVAFGVKLRSASQLRRFRREVACNHLIKSPVCEDQCDKQTMQEVREHVGHTFKKPQTSISSSPSTFAEDPARSGFSIPLKNNLPSTGDSQVMPAEIRATSSDHREAEPVLTEPQPQTASSEVSWMSLAMEKTRSLQQLFTSRFPRDFTGVQTATRSPVQPMNQPDPQTGAQIQDVKMQQSSTTALFANPPLTGSLNAATVKPSQVSVNQKMPMTSPVQSMVFTEAQRSKQSSDFQSHPNANQCSSHPHDPTKPWTPQSPLRSFTQTDSSSHTSAQQPLWSNQVLQQSSQPKSTTSFSSISSATAALSPGGEGEGSMQGKEETGALWCGSVSKRAAFLEQKAKKTTPTETKEVDLKKVHTEAQTVEESPASAKTTPVITDTKPEIKMRIKPAESNPNKAPDRPHEDKWIRKNVASSSPPTQTTGLQSMSDSSQPSWMELAKRKSMAWSDKTMD